MDWKDFVKNNPAALLSEKQVRALLCDAFLNDQLKVNLMMDAFSMGIINEMRASFPADQFAATRWSKKLVTDFGVSDGNARWAIDNWKSAITPQILHELDAAEKRASIDEEDERRKREEKALLLVEEVKKRQEAEEEAREEVRRNTPDIRLKTKEDYSDYYINPSLEVSKEYIYIPCGYGQGDNGFLIHGIKKENLCRHPDANIYALIYNYLIRSSTISEDDIPKCLRELDIVYELNYQAIYRMAITLLQMIHFFEFIETNATCDRDKITEEIKDYFVLPFAKLKSDEALFNELSLKEIIAKTTTGVSKNTLINLERINSNRYSYKLDLALFCGQLRMNDSFDESRLDRILSKLPDNEIIQLANALVSLYPSCNTLAKIRILNYMERDASSLKTTYMDFLKNAYRDGQKDEIYYGIMANILNKHFIGMRRSAHV